MIYLYKHKFQPVERTLCYRCNKCEQVCRGEGFQQITVEHN